MVTYVPKRGDVVWLDFDPQKIQKTRSALVISPYRYNFKTGLALFMPITSKINSKSMEGAVLSDQIRLLDWRARKASLICQISEDEIQDILPNFRRY